MMPDREKVIAGLNDIGGFIAGRIGFEQARNFLRTIDDALAMLKEQPLRCESCSYHRKDGWCNEHGREVRETDYCSFGAWEGR